MGAAGEPCRSVCHCSGGGTLTEGARAARPTPAKSLALLLQTAACRLAGVGLRGKPAPGAEGELPSENPPPDLSVSLLLLLRPANSGSGGPSFLPLLGFPELPALPVHPVTPTLRPTGRIELRVRSPAVAAPGFPSRCLVLRRRRLVFNPCSEALRSRHGAGWGGCAGGVGWVAGWWCFAEGRRFLKQSQMGASKPHWWHVGGENLGPYRVPCCAPPR